MVGAGVARRVREASREATSASRQKEGCCSAGREAGSPPARTGRTRPPPREPPCGRHGGDRCEPDPADGHHRERRLRLRAGAAPGRAPEPDLLRAGGEDRPEPHVLAPAAAASRAPAAPRTVTPRRRSGPSSRRASDGGRSSSPTCAPSAPERSAQSTRSFTMQTTPRVRQRATTSAADRDRLVAPVARLSGSARFEHLPRPPSAPSGDGNLGATPSSASA